MIFFVFIMLVFIPNFDKIRFQPKRYLRKSRFINLKLTLFDLQWPLRSNLIKWMICNFIMLAYKWPMVSEGIKERTIQGIANISSSLGSTIMFDIWNSFSQLCLEIYGEKMYFFFSLSTFKWFKNTKKSEKNC